MTNLEITVAQHGQQLEHSSCRLKRIEEKLDRLHTWLVGLLGGMVASLVLLVINITRVGRWRVDGPAPVQARGRTKAHVGKHRRDKSMSERNQR